MLLNSLFVFFIHLKLEMLTQFLALNDRKYDRCTKFDYSINQVSITNNITNSGTFYEV